MKSFAGIVSLNGSPPDEALLRHLGRILSLPTSSEPLLELHARCGMVSVAHRDESAGRGPQGELLAEARALRAVAS
jgi:hypothetical protein